MIALLTAVLQAVAMPNEEPVAPTRHHTTLDGRRLDYTARAGRLPIRDNETGDVHAWVFFVSYTLDSADSRAGHGPALTPSRPLTFAWNDGPGSNAAPALRVFVTCGYYDLVCDVAANDWVARQLDPDVRRRVTVTAYHGGHAVYLDDDARRQLRKDVAAFLTR